MKLSILVFLVIGATLIFFGCSEKNPSAPELSQSDQVTHTLAKPHLTGTTDADFVLSNAPHYWVGTINIDGVIYGLRFESLGPPRPYPQASPFKEYFEIYELGVVTNVYLAGPTAGVLNYGNSKFVENGEVDVANSPFEEWMGRKVHVSGTVFWEIYPELPDYALGTLRIN
jgi:hypothetical protein